MEKQTKVIITVAAIATIAAGVYIWNKKKNTSEKSDSGKGGNGNSISTTSSSGIVASGLTQQQVKKVQDKINTMYTTGVLSGFGFGAADALKKVVEIGSKFVINNAIPNKVSTDAALEKFKADTKQIMPLKVDGAYGSNTTAAVMALQTYLNTVKNAGLAVDGIYGPATDAATGWHIINVVSGFCLPPKR